MRSSKTLIALGTALVGAAIGLFVTHDRLVDPSFNPTEADGGETRSDQRSFEQAANEVPVGANEIAVAVIGRQLESNDVRIEIRHDWQPVAGARIVALPWTDELASRLRRVNGVEPEELARVAREFASDSHGHASIPRFASRIAIGVKAQDLAPAVQLVAPSDEAVEIELLAGHEIRFRVYDPDRVPIHGARVTMAMDHRSLLEVDPDIDPIERALMPLLHAEGTSESDIVPIRGLRAGGHRAVATHPDYATSYAWRIDIPAVADPDWIMMAKSAHVDGVVVRKSDRSPIEGARVEIRQLIKGQSHGDGCSVLTDASGRFECPHAWATDDARFDGRAMCWKDGYGAQVIPYGFLKPGDRKTIVFELEEAAPFFGRVEYSTGGAASGVDVSASVDMVYLETARTRADGTFVMHSLTKDRSQFFDVQGKGIARLLATVPSPWPAEWPYVFVVNRTFAVSGRLVADGHPLANGRVRACLEAGRVARTVEQWADVDPTIGSFSFAELPPGHYYFDAIADGYSLTRAKGFVVDEETATKPIEISLSRGSRVRGVVRDERSGAPIEGATVKVADYGEASSQQMFGSIDLGVTTDVRGHFEIESVERGRAIALLVEKKGFAPKIDRFEVNVGSTVVDREIDLVIGGKLVVKAIRPDGLPVGDFTVDVSSEASGYRRVLGRGTASTDDLLPGTYSVKVGTREPDADYWGGMRQFDHVEIVAGRTTTVEASFADGLVIRGAIRGEVAARTVGGFAAYAREIGGTTYPWQAEVKWESRTFAIYGIPPGRYEVLAESLDREPKLSAQRIVELVPGIPCHVEFEFGEYQLEGKVTNSTGTPVVAAAVYFEVNERLTPSGDERGDVPSEDAMTTSRTTNEGRYVAAGLSPGVYRAEIRARDYAYAIERVVIDEREFVGNRDFRLEPECRVRVFVGDRGGASVNGAEIVVRRDGEDPSEESLPSSVVDSDGARVIRGAGTGHYHLEVRATGRMVRRATIACIGGERRDVHVELRRFARIHVDLRDVLGAPLKQLEFTLFDLESGEPVRDWIERGDVAMSAGSLITDDQGRLRIDGIPEGRYRILGYGIDGEVETTFEVEAKATTLVAAR